MRKSRLSAVRVGLAAFASGVLLWTGVTDAQGVVDTANQVREATPTSSQSATGVVFHDTNGDGVRDPGEGGIPNVLVTNGLDVVQTDADGRYTLSVTDETVISIVKPAGYKVPVDRNNLPRFYYIHQPNGTPPELNLGYPGIDPTGPLPAAVDFPLVAADESDQFKAMMIADPQPQSSAEVDYIRDDFVAQVIGTDAAFGKTHGDIMFDDLSLFPRYNAVIGQIGIPWWNVPGNHEINFPSPNDKYSTETFKRYYGPTYYAHEHGQAFFITLDTTYYEGTNPQDVRGRGAYRGHLPEEQVIWLRNLLQYIPTDKLIVVSTHIPWTHPFDDSPGVNTDNREAIFRLLCEGRERVVSFAGHTHTSYHVYYGPDAGCNNENGWHENVIATVSGAWWSGPFDERGIPSSIQYDGTPNGYHELVVTGNQYVTNYVPLDKLEKNQMRILCDAAFHGTSADGSRDYRLGELWYCHISQDHVPFTKVVIDFFSGGPKSRVWFEVAGQAVETTRVVRTDPFIEELYQRTDDKKSWVNAVLSDHIWEGELPAVAPGAHTIKAYATDEYGREYVQTKVLEVHSTGQASVAEVGGRATAFSAATSVGASVATSVPDYPIANTEVANRGLLPY